MDSYTGGGSGGAGAGAVSVAGGITLAGLGIGSWAAIGVALIAVVLGGFLIRRHFRHGRSVGSR